jgi:hypothetical protein
MSKGQTRRSRAAVQRKRLSTLGTHSPTSRRTKPPSWPASRGNYTIRDSCARSNVAASRRVPLRSRSRNLSSANRFSGELRALPVLAIALLIAAAVITSIPTESGERYPTAKDAASEARYVRPILAEKSGVWLVPLGEPGSVDVGRLAQELAAHYRLPVAVLPDIALPRWTLDANERSLIAEQLILLMRQAYRAQAGAAIIGITDYEMYAMREDRTHVFSWRAPPHYGVVSTSSLAANVLDRLRGHSRHERTRKLVARNIGFLYYRRHEVDDPHSLLRPPMHGNGDIDKLKETL